MIAFLNYFFLKHILQRLISDRDSANKTLIWERSGKVLLCTSQDDDRCIRNVLRVVKASHTGCWGICCCLVKDHLAESLISDRVQIHHVEH